MGYIQGSMCTVYLLKKVGGFKWHSVMVPLNQVSYVFDVLLSDLKLGLLK